jgi:hypothetical protein
MHFPIRGDEVFTADDSEKAWIAFFKTIHIYKFPVTVMKTKPAPKSPLGIVWDRNIPKVTWRNGEFIFEQGRH